MAEQEQQQKSNIILEVRYIWSGAEDYSVATYNLDVPEGFDIDRWLEENLDPQAGVRKIYVEGRIITGDYTFPEVPHPHIMDEILSYSPPACYASFRRVFERVRGRSESLPSLSNVDVASSGSNQHKRKRSWRF